MHSISTTTGGVVGERKEVGGCGRLVDIGRNMQLPPHQIRLDTDIYCLEQPPSNFLKSEWLPLQQSYIRRTSHMHQRFGGAPDARAAQLLEHWGNSAGVEQQSGKCEMMGSNTSKIIKPFQR